MKRKPNGTKHQQGRAHFNYVRKKIEKKMCLTPYEKALIMKDILLRRFNSKEELDHSLTDISINLVNNDKLEYTKY